MPSIPEAMHPIAIAVLIIILALLVVGVFAYRYHRRRRARAARPQAPLMLAPRAQPLPTVLVHGLCGFDHIAVLGQRVRYFRGIPQSLRQTGATVHTVKLPPLASVPERAQTLKAYIQELPHERVNLIAHSMGGLDARYAIARLGMANRVASLITVATPHRGSPLADLSGTAPVRALRGLIGQAGVPTEAIDWLTTASTGQLNRDIDNVDEVLYASVVGHAPPSAVGLNPMLLSGYLFLNGCAGPNDGMVPVSSQAWGEVLDEIEADHWAQIGWSLYFDASQFYRRLLDTLMQRGM